jgi:hypothetical protein
LLRQCFKKCHKLGGQVTKWMIILEQSESGRNQKLWYCENIGHQDPVKLRHGSNIINQGEKLPKRFWYEN